MPYFNVILQYRAIYTLMGTKYNVNGIRGEMNLMIYSKFKPMLKEREQKTKKKKKSLMVTLIIFSTVSHIYIGTQQALHWMG